MTTKEKDQTPSDTDADLYNRGTIISIDGQKHDDGDIFCFLAMGEELYNSIKMSKEKATLIAGRSSSSTIFHLCPLYGTLPYHVQSRVL